jgi:proteasome alpha subunit
LVVEAGDPNRMFRISYDGTLNDERRVAAIGGKSEALLEALRGSWREDLTLEDALAVGQAAFRLAEGRESEGWEAAVLDRTHGRRAFRRLQL